MSSEDAADVTSPHSAPSLTTAATTEVPEMNAAVPKATGLVMQIFLRRDLVTVSLNPAQTRLQLFSSPSTSTLTRPSLKE